MAPWANRMGVEPAPRRERSTSIGRSVQDEPHLIDYVLVHELTQLRHRDHRAGFWQVVEQAMPDYDARLKRGAG
jgi:Protein of unknown function DUF45